MQKRSIIIISLVAVGFIALVTLSVLSLVHKNSSHPAAKNDAAATQTAQSIMTQLQKGAKAGTILEGSTVSLMSNKQAQTMYVQDAGLNKEIAITTTDGVLITQDNGYTAKQLQVVTSDITSFLAKQGVSTVQQTNDTTVLLTVSNQYLICQVKTLSPASKPVLQMQLLCTNKSSYNDQVSIITHLIGLWTAASSTTYDQLSLDTVTKDPYTIALLYAMPKGASTVHIPIFVKNKDNWTYIGDAGAGTSVVANDKYVINQSIKDGLDNSGYGSFLHDVLFGTIKNNT